MSDPQPRLLAHAFEPLPLSRGRAYLSLTFGALALLLLGGVLSYASGSPDVHGSVSTYWTVFFSFYALAFGGAAVFGAFPRLALRATKLAWLVLLVLVLAVALAIRSTASAEAGAPASPTAIGSYAVALLPVLVGLWWRGEQAGSGQSAVGGRQ